MKISDSRYLTRTAIWLLILFLLSPVLFFPISTDLAIFVSAGKAIAAGQKIYVDFIDLKQPLIYYIFALFHLITNSGELQLRIIDFLIQFTTIFFLFRLVREESGNDTIAYMSAALYAISYSALNFNQTMQIESFSGLLLVFIAAFQLKEQKNSRDYLLAGALTAVLAALKITFASVVFSFLIYDLFKAKFDRKMIFVWISGIIGFLLVFILCSFPLFDPQIRAAYQNVWKYLSFYSSMPPLNMEMISSSLKSIGSFLGDKLSVLILISVFTGVYVSFRENRNYRLAETALLLCFAMFAGIAFEKKFYEYHFVRMYVPLMILSGMGLFYLMQSFKAILAERNKVKIISAFLVLLFLLVLSPIPRFANLQKSSFYYLTNKEKYNTFYERSGSSVILRKTHLETAAYINAHKRTGDRVILMSTASSVINYFLPELIHSKFSLSCFYLGYAEIPEYQQLIADEISHADWIIVQNNDGNYHAFGHNNSSFDMLRIKMPLGSLVFSTFDEETRIGNFIIYRKKTFTN